jgi:hypothetical protein
VDIRLNGENLDYSLENETTLSEVLENINDWLLGAGYIVTRISINNNEMISYLEAIDSKNNLESIKELDIEASSLLEHRLDQLQTVNRYIQHIMTLKLDSSELASQKNILEIVTDFSSLMNSVPQILDGPVHLNGNDTYGIKFIHAKLKELSELAVDNSNLGKRKEIWDNCFSKIEFFQQVLHSRIKEYTNCNQEIESASKVLSATVSMIPEMTTLLQTGQTEKALTSIFRLLEIATKYIRILNILEQLALIRKDLDQSVHEKIEEKSKILQEILNEVHNAFANEDFVLLADVLEYELPDALQNLQNIGMELSKGNV